MNIGDAAEASGLPAKTIRYYEDIGLVTANRAANGYRSYADKHLHKLRFIQRARSLGFSVEDCRQLLGLYDDQHRSSSEVKEVAESRLSEIDRKIEELKSMRKLLSSLIQDCRGDHRPNCPILDELSGWNDVGKVGQ